MQKAQHESSFSSNSSNANSSTSTSAPDNVNQPLGDVQDVENERQADVSDESIQASNKAAAPAPRAYERSGLYPAGGKAFRIWALLAWLAGVVIVLGIVSAILNVILI